MRCRWVGMNCWEVTDEAGKTVTVNRVIVTGATTIACECGGYWDERSKMSEFCRHMTAIEEHVERRAKATEQEVARFFDEERLT